MDVLVIIGGAGMVQANAIILYFIYLVFIMYIIFLNYSKTKRLKKMNETFLMIIHDIKNYSANIDAAGQFLLVKAYKENNSSMVKHLNIIANNIKEMNGLMESYSKSIKLAETTKENINEAEVVSLVNEAVKLCTFYARRKNITIEVDSPWSDRIVKLDKSKFIRILSNLIMNAVKYSDENGKVLISIYQDGNFINVSIEDNGKGMSENELRNVFKKYYRAEDSVDSNEINLGIGLYGSRKLARSMGGEILVESTEGKGSIFTLRIPIKASPMFSFLGIPIVLKKKDKSKPA